MKYNSPFVVYEIPTEYLEGELNDLHNRDFDITSVTTFYKEPTRTVHAVVVAKLRSEEKENKMPDVHAQLERLKLAAIALREAQKNYMLNRSSESIVLKESLGKIVGKKAEELDKVLAEIG